MTNPTLSQMKSSFARYFITDEIKSRRHQQLLELRYRQGETVRSFSNRFIEALTLNGIKVGASQTDYAYVKEIYFFKLPASVRRYHGSLDLNSIGTCLDLIDLTSAFPGVPDDVIFLPQHCSECANELMCSCRSKGKLKFSPQVHLNEVKRQAVDPPNNSPKRRQIKMICYKGCNEVYQQGHDCPNQAQWMMKSAQERASIRKNASNDIKISNLELIT
jgi:hypothetical protein